MNVLAFEFSKLTDRYQTTVPGRVRKQLGLGKGDRIRYCTEPDGRVFIESDQASEEDPVLARFLNFIANDIEASPQRIQPFDRGLHDRLKALVGDVEVDLDGPLSPDDE